MSSSTFPLLNATNLSIFTRRTVPLGDPKAAILLVHGFTWHSGYFANLTEELAAQGVAVVYESRIQIPAHHLFAFAHYPYHTTSAGTSRFILFAFERSTGFLVQSFDLQGHGQSDGFVPGLRGYAESFDDHLCDIRQQLTILQAAVPGQKVFVYGESFGGLLVLQLSLSPDASRMAGMVLAAPVIAVAPSVLPPWPIVCLLRLLAKVFPRLPLPSAKIKDGHLEAFGDRALAMRSLEDPLVLFVPPTLGFLDQVLQSTATLQTQLHAVDVPFLVLHGEQDSRTMLRNSQVMHNQARCIDKCIKTYAEAKHQLLQDRPAIVNAVILDIKQWLLARL